MRPAALRSICQSTRRNSSVTLPRCRRRNLSVLAQQIEPTPRTRPEPIQIPHEHPPVRQRPEPHVLVASELAHIRKSMLDLLGTAHPGLANVAECFFLHPSKQLRSLLVLLFSRATNGLGQNWDGKQWDATCEMSTGRSEELDRPLTLSNVLNEWNLSMRDDTASFESPFALQQSIPRAPYPPRPPLSQNIASPSLLPTQIRLAQIVEMIHVASLLHDGIVEIPEASSESNEPPSTHSYPESEGFGNKLSILGGDFLLGRASTALSRLGEAEVVELVASVISNLVEGEFLRTEGDASAMTVSGAGPTTLPAAWELYQRKTYLKTASLMAKGARSAVVLGGAMDGDIWKEVAYVFGRNLGFAHQVRGAVVRLEDITEKDIASFS